MRAKALLTLAAVVTAAASSLAGAPARAVTGLPPGVLTIGGAVSRPLTLTVSQLAQLPQKTVTVSFLSGTTPYQHTYRGPLLGDVLAVVKPKPGVATTIGDLPPLSKTSTSGGAVVSATA